MLPYHTSYLAGQISPAGEAFGVACVAAIREAVGPEVEILIDAHGHYNVPTAVRLARRLEPYRIGWFEEPTPPESLEALRAVREQVGVPICVGERLYTRWDFLPVLAGRLADYLMPDVVWTGGISEVVRIATMAEAYHVPVTPHNAMGRSRSWPAPTPCSRCRTSTASSTTSRTCPGTTGASTAPSTSAATGYACLPPRSGRRPGPAYLRAHAAPAGPDSLAGHVDGAGSRQGIAHSAEARFSRHPKG